MTSRNTSPPQEADAACTGGVPYIARHPGTGPYGREPVIFGPKAGTLVAMTGPEHYAAAENLLDQLTNDDPSGFDYPVEQMIGMAQIHAQLALAAATALSGIEQPAPYGANGGAVALGGHDAADWQRVAGDRR